MIETELIGDCIGDLWKECFQCLSRTDGTSYAGDGFELTSTACDTCICVFDFAGTLGNPLLKTEKRVIQYLCHAVERLGEDAGFEYLYRFVSRGRVRPGGAAANRDLLDHGTLSVARFDAEGQGRWLPLRHGHGPLTRAQGFADQGEVVIKARQASDALGATKLDRPE